MCRIRTMYLISSFGFSLLLTLFLVPVGPPPRPSEKLDKLPNNFRFCSVFPLFFQNIFAHPFVSNFIWRMCHFSGLFFRPGFFPSFPMPRLLWWHSSVFVFVFAQRRLTWLDWLTERSRMIRACFSRPRIIERHLASIVLCFAFLSWCCKSHTPLGLRLFSNLISFMFHYPTISLVARGKRLSRSFEWLFYTFHIEISFRQQIRGPFLFSLSLSLLVPLMYDILLMFVYDRLRLKSTSRRTLCFHFNESSIGGALEKALWRRVVTLIQRQALRPPSECLLGSFLMFDCINSECRRQINLRRVRVMISARPEKKETKETEKYLFLVLHLWMKWSEVKWSCSLGSAFGILQFSAVESSPRTERKYKVVKLNHSWSSKDLRSSVDWKTSMAIRSDSSCSKVHMLRLDSSYGSSH